MRLPEYNPEPVRHEPTYIVEGMLLPMAAKLKAGLFWVDNAPRLSLPARLASLDFHLRRSPLRALLNPGTGKTNQKTLTDDF